MINPHFWQGKRVFITGHTGFKGAWACLWLQSLGAKVTGYALPPPTSPSLFALANVKKGMQHIEGDIRDLEKLTAVMQVAQPEIVIHMAAQSLVRYSYQNPVETYATNVMGTVNVLEAVRQTNSVKAAIVVTSDKCYENREQLWGYRENDPMGGFDPYSNSKGCAELVTASYRASFMPANEHQKHGKAIASVRAGNVIGGGDWAFDRLVPDIIKSLMDHQPVTLRSPNAVRPWQHVLEPLGGYLLLAEKMVENGAKFAEGWNFGPDDKDAKTVEWMTKTLTENWGNRASYRVENAHLHEAQLLKLDCTKARTLLNWQPKWDAKMAVLKINDWYKAYLAGENMAEFTLQQIQEYQQLATPVNDEEPLTPLSGAIAPEGEVVASITH
jgi:CDP-glucose 4,6-dehydratase